MAAYALTRRCPACHGVAELVGLTGTELVYSCPCGERVVEAVSFQPTLTHELDKKHEGL